MIHAERDPALRARIQSIVPLPFVRAGSALVWSGERLLVVEDDALAVAWFDPRTGELEHVTLEGFGGPLEKAVKPDFEAAFAGKDGAITILGSGSTAARCRSARLDVKSGSVHFSDDSALFDAIAARLGTRPNIEGAVVVGETLRLFHRGSGSSPSAVVDVPATALGARVAPQLSVEPYELGAVSGVPLAFTDAAPNEDALLYLAVAEDAPNAIDDGPIAGAAVGVLSHGRARYAILEEQDGTPSKRKVEGIALDPATHAAYLVTDPDDPKKPAELCRVALEGFDASNPG